MKPNAFKIGLDLWRYAPDSVSVHVTNYPVVCCSWRIASWQGRPNDTSAVM